MGEGLPGLGGLIAAGGAAGILVAALWSAGGRRRVRAGGAASPGALAEEVRPGEAGVMLDRHVRPVHLTATLLDLAVRGYLHISEVADDRRPPSDWVLIWQRGPHSGRLRRYERTLLFSLFSSRSQIHVSELPSAARGLHRAKSELSRQVVTAGWFRRRPHSYRPILITPLTRQGAQLRTRLVTFRDRLRLPSRPVPDDAFQRTALRNPAYLVVFRLEDPLAHLTIMMPDGTMVADWYAEGLCPDAPTTLRAFTDTTSAAIAFAWWAGGGLGRFSFLRPSSSRGSFRYDPHSDPGFGTPGRRWGDGHHRGWDDGHGGDWGAGSTGAAGVTAAVGERRR